MKNLILGLLFLVYCSLGDPPGLHVDPFEDYGISDIPEPLPDHDNLDLFKSRFFQPFLGRFIQNQKKGFPFPGGIACEKDAHKLCAGTLHICEGSFGCALQCITDHAFKVSEECLRAHPCADDIVQLCRDAQHGSNAVIHCLKAHSSSLSSSCKNHHRCLKYPDIKCPEVDYHEINQLPRPHEGQRQHTFFHNVHNGVDRFLHNLRLRHLRNLNNRGDSLTRRELETVKQEELNLRREIEELKHNPQNEKRNFDEIRKEERSLKNEERLLRDEQLSLKEKERTLELREDKVEHEISQFRSDHHDEADNQVINGWWTASKIALFVVPIAIVAFWSIIFKFMRLQNNQNQDSSYI